MIDQNFCIIGVDNDLIDFIKRNNSFFIGYFSKKGFTYKSLKKKKKIGDHSLKKWKIINKKFNPISIIAIDDGKIREKLFKKIYKKNCKNVHLKNSYIAKNTLININRKKAILTQDFSKIMSNVILENGVKIHIGAHIHHDCKVGKFATIAPKAVVLGNVKIGDYAYIGANSTIKQRIRIGRGAIVGAGSVVIKNVKDNDIVAGVPAKSLKR
tara:strand:+ start:2670 stop:3305 length:636 start_codon:yes stop_codon:yes gene_type:complete